MLTDTWSAKAFAAPLTTIHDVVRVMKEWGSESGSQSSDVDGDEDPQQA